MVIETWCWVLDFGDHCGYCQRCSRYPCRRQTNQNTYNIRLCGLIEGLPYTTRREYTSLTLLFTIDLPYLRHPLPNPCPPANTCESTTTQKRPREADTTSSTLSDHNSREFNDVTAAREDPHYRTIILAITRW